MCLDFVVVVEFVFRQFQDECEISVGWYVVQSVTYNKCDVKAVNSLFHGEYKDLVNRKDAEHVTKVHGREFVEAKSTTTVADLRSNYF